jgi:hypothetical protein
MLRFGFSHPKASPIQIQVHGTHASVWHGHR